MYAAFSESKELVYASQAHRHPSQNWFCPKCGHKLVLKRSSKGKAFFAHLRACGGEGKSTKGQGESKLHRQAKELMYWSLKSRGYSPVLEEAFSYIDRIADVFVPELRSVIEIQRTAIPASDIRQRTADYQGLGLKVYWLMVLEDEEDLGETWPRRMLQWRTDLGYYRNYLQISSPCLLREIHLPIFYNKGSYTYGEIHQPLDSIFQAAFTKKMRIYEVKVSASLAPYQRTRQIQTFIKNPHYRLFLRGLYEAGLSIFHVPDWCLETNDDCLLLETPIWQYRTYLYTFLCRQKASFSKTSLRFYCQDLIKAGKVNLIDMPLIERDPTVDLVDASLTKLEARGIIQAIGKEHWMFINEGRNELC